MRCLAFSSLFLLLPLLASASVDSGLLAMAPPEAILLTGVDVSRTTASPFGQYLLKRVNAEDSHFRDMIAQTGFDPRRDLQQLMFAGLSKPGAGESRFAILARGTFDASRISAAALKSGAKTSTLNGLTVYQQGDSTRHTFAFAFPDTGIAVMGDLATVQEILTRSAATPAIDPQLVRFVNQVGGSNDIWFATLMSGSFLGGVNPALQGQNIQALQSIVQSAGGMQFGDTVNFVFDAVTRSPQDASSLADVLRFVSNLVQMQSGNDPRGAIAAAALQTVQVQANGANVHATAAITEDQLEQLAQTPQRKAKAGI